MVHWLLENTVQLQTCSIWPLNFGVFPSLTTVLLYQYLTIRCPFVRLVWTKSIGSSLPWTRHPYVLFVSRLPNRRLVFNRWSAGITIVDFMSVKTLPPPLYRPYTDSFRLVQRPVSVKKFDRNNVTRDIHSYLIRWSNFSSYFFEQYYHYQITHICITVSLSLKNVK